MNNAIINKLLPLLITIIVAIVLIDIFFKFIGIMMPFIIAYLIASLAYPIKKKLLKIKLGNSFSSIVSIILIFLIILTILFGIGLIIKSNGAYIVNGIQNIISAVTKGLDNFGKILSEKIPALQESKIDTSYKEIVKKISENSATISKHVLSFAKDIPKMGLFVIITIIASFFTIIEYEKILIFSRKLIDRLPILKKTIKILKESVFIGMKSWFKAQLFIMLFSSIICSLGFLLSGYGYWLLLGIIVAVADALPIIGSGAFLIPIALYNILVGKIFIAIIMFTSYVLVIITRQMIEPRIVGKSLGINPLLTLIAIYLGFRFGGLIGVFIAIFLLVIIVGLYKAKGEKNDLLS